MLDDAQRIARIGAVLASEGRAAILCALMAGTAHTQTELGRAVGLSASTVSEHVGVLLDHGFVTVEAQGRHRYVRLAGAEVADLVERLSNGLAAPVAALPRVSADLRFARSCYGHLAGQLGVALYDALVRHGWMRDDGEQLSVTVTGGHALAELGIRPRSGRRCLDWSQRRPHLGGPTGAAVMSCCLDRGWLRRQPTRPRVITLTERGRRELPAAFELELP